MQSLDSVELNEEILVNPVMEKTYESSGLTASSVNKNLSQIEQKIFKLHFKQGKTLTQISKELGIRREKVRQIKHLLLRKTKINQKLTENLYAINNHDV